MSGMTRYVAAGLLLLGLAAAQAGAVDDDPLLYGAKGKSPVRLFDKEDVRTLLEDDWDYPFVSICAPTTARQIRHNLAAIQDTADAKVVRVYVPIFALDDDVAPTEAYTGIVEATIDDGALDSMRTILREEWVFDEADADYRWDWAGL